MRDIFVLIKGLVALGATVLFLGFFLGLAWGLLVRVFTFGQGLVL